jgi:enoyl-CoA hydratase/carnithine racemase
LRATKRTLRETAFLSRADALRSASTIYIEDLMRAEDPVEGLRAFLEKRTPRWRHQ